MKLMTEREGERVRNPNHCFGLVLVSLMHEKRKENSLERKQVQIMALRTLIVPPKKNYRLRSPI